LILWDLSLLFSCYDDAGGLHSFPTRRSSDLAVERDQLRRDGAAIDRLLAQGGGGDGLPTEALSAIGSVQHAPELSNALKELSDKDRKSTRLNSSHVAISYAVFCLKKKKYSQQ